MRKLVTFATLAIAASVSAQSPLTTTYANNNGGGVGGGLYFNLTVAAGSDVTLGAIETNFSSAIGTAGSLNVYIIGPGGTYVGNQAAGVGAWGGTPADSGVAVAAGVGIPTFVALSTGITLLAGQTYGVAYEAVGLAFAYTNGDGTPGVPGSGTNQSYSTLDLQFDGGSANNLAFGAGIFDPRVANTTIHYVLGPGPIFTGLSEPYGGGCYNNPITYYELFPAMTFDMAGVAGISVNGFQLIPNGVGGYVISPASGLWFGDDGTGLANIEGATPGTAPISASILNVDDGVTTVDLAAIAFTNLINVPGGNLGIETSLTIDSNGRSSVDSGMGSDFTPTAAEMVAGPQMWANFWNDLSPNIQGGVHWDVDAGTTNGYMTFHNVPIFGVPAGAPGNTFQMAISPGGLIEMRYENISDSMPTIVGLTVGGGVADPGSSDIYDGLAMTVNIVDLGAFSSPPELNSNIRPVEGAGPLELITSNIDATVIFGAILASFVQDIPGTDLGFLGMPGCSAHIDPFVNSSLGLFFPAGSPSVSQTFAAIVPPGFSGLEFYMQAGLLQPGANAQGVVVTNGLRWRFGNL